MEDSYNTSNYKLSFFLKDGHILCDTCFHKREKSADKTKKEHIISSNWGLYMIPIVNSFAMAYKAGKCMDFPDGYIYHIYQVMFDEQWSKNSSDGNCNECNKNVNSYYQLKSTKTCLPNFF